MADNGEQQPSGPPDYKVYRSREGPPLAAAAPRPLRPQREDSARLPKWLAARQASRAGPARAPGPAAALDRKRVLKWVGIAALGWILLSFLAFAVSAQLQSFKLSGEAKDALHGNPLLLPSAQTILVLGTDARPPDTKEPGAAPSQKCFEQQAHGDAPHDGCEVGQFRADTLMLIRAGGGSLPQTLDPARQLRRNPRPEPAEDQRRLRLRRRQGCRSKRSKASSASRSTTSRSSTSPASKT